VADLIPQVLDGARVLKYAWVTASVEPTGATRHTVDGTLTEAASALAVASYGDPPSGFYLFYLDENGTVMTDTLHDSVEAALDQAAFEYVGLSWADVPAS
jgi:hypothetical protein